MKKTNFIPSILIGLGLFLNINGYSQDDETKRQIKQNVDWLYDQTSPPAKLSVWWNVMLPFPNGYGISHVPRLWRSGRACLLIGVLYRMTGDLAKARDCLQAGQAHNPDVVRQFADYADYVMDYATPKYREEALKYGALNGATSGVADILRTLSSLLFDR